MHELAFMVVVDGAWSGSGLATSCRYQGVHGEYVGRRVSAGHAPVVAEWVGLPSLNLASASAGEFLTGE